MTFIGQLFLFVIIIESLIVYLFIQLLVSYLNYNVKKYILVMIIFIQKFQAAHYKIFK